MYLAYHHGLSSVVLHTFMSCDSIESDSLIIQKYRKMYLAYHHGLSSVVLHTVLCHIYEIQEDSISVQENPV